MEILRFPSILVRNHHVVGLGRKAGLAPSDPAVSASHANHSGVSGNNRNSFRHSKIPGPGIIENVASGVVTLRNRVGPATPEWNGDLRRILTRRKRLRRRSGRG